MRIGRVIATRHFPLKFTEFTFGASAADRSKLPYRLPIAVFSHSRITGAIAHLFDNYVTSLNVLISQ
ncbi:hypothetical protein CO651_17195 [Rhizobium phaseoli]|uniref:Uncharacterized protein n=1 Tax=Rhizobium etli (strain CIAT 652) TaxID=491916 RepID=B3PTS9_RHIE6|nr:hypothetical protein RHECIAT_CH0002967 [Rhizobium etli CIAT 652]NKE87356.1 hypothetical protein [Rhizobium phaseoli]NKF14253.1 hypothetical protein [Rhizobium phaseoli]PCD65841.1 hypothetical protein CO648_20480 [Rhizobium phaseoli]PDS70665.1 hypothetical protein CO651_17195 [Rhizobium phaseoli]